MIVAKSGFIARLEEQMSNAVVDTVFHSRTRKRDKNVLKYISGLKMVLDNLKKELC